MCTQRPPRQRVNGACRLVRRPRTAQRGIPRRRRRHAATPVRARRLGAQRGTFDLCNAYMTVYTTMTGGDAGHTQAAASPRKARAKQLCSKVAQEFADRPPFAERVADERRPRRTRAQTLAALAAHEGTKEAADSSRAQARCHEQNSPLISSALPAQLAVPPLACRWSHPPPPATPPVLLYCRSPTPPAERGAELG